MSLLALLAGIQGCKKESDPTPPAKAADEAEEPAGRAGEARGDDDDGAPAQGAAQRLEPAPEVRLHDQPVERRLHSDRVEASSFLWTDWNRFQENYHPRYLLDGDPATAWVEGSDNSGAGEWIRVHVSPLVGATRIRLRLRNGYHKSKSLFTRNARARTVKLVALPGGHEHEAVLADAMGWQELVFEQPEGPLEAIELRIVDVYEGTKYTDLCLSDAELYVTALNVENPAFEKAKLDKVLAWKKERLEAAALFQSQKARDLPIAPGYHVVREPDGERVSMTGSYSSLRASLALARKRQPELGAVIARAMTALETEFEGWVPIELIAKDLPVVPPVDGLDPAQGEELLYGGTGNAFMVPVLEKGVLLSSEGVSAFAAKERDFGVSGPDRCRPGQRFFWRAPRAEDAGPMLSQLLMLSCIAEETRDGMATHTVFQLLEFDGDGRLAMLIGPSSVQSFEWEAREVGPLLRGGRRFDGSDGMIERLAMAGEVTRP